MKQEVFIIFNKTVSCVFTFVVFGQSSADRNIWNRESMLSQFHFKHFATEMKHYGNPYHMKMVSNIDNGIHSQQDRRSTRVYMAVRYFKKLF